MVYCEKWEDRFGFIYLQRVIRGGSILWGRNGRLQWSVITSHSSHMLF